VRELCDFGERTPDGPGLRVIVRAAFEFAAAAVIFVRFFGLASSLGFCDGSFSLSSSAVISSLELVSRGTDGISLNVCTFSASHFACTSQPRAVILAQSASSQPRAWALAVLAWP
jgi:hypothetical protein